MEDSNKERVEESVKFDEIIEESDKESDVIKNSVNPIFECDETRRKIM